MVTRAALIVVLLLVGATPLMISMAALVGVIALSVAMEFPATHYPVSGSTSAFPFQPRTP
ncbi:MAG TPA: hypothetical protein VIQ60_02495 [Gemmatimonadaceae bacterium]|jgi:hypothetical protein